MLLIMVIAGGGWWWLRANPAYNPWVPLALGDPVTWATRGKIVALAEDADRCRSLLRNGGVSAESLPPVGEGRCRADSRTRLLRGGAVDFRFSPEPAAPACPVVVALAIWMRDGVQPAARRHFGRSVSRVEHIGTYNCRRIGGPDSSWSEHATANAIDIAGFEMADGTRIDLKRDWDGDGARAAFLREVRSAACPLFATVLSPDYNAAHANHFHFDQAKRAAGRGVCR